MIFLTKEDVINYANINRKDIEKEKSLLDLVKKTEDSFVRFCVMDVTKAYSKDDVMHQINSFRYDIYFEMLGITDVDKERVTACLSKTFTNAFYTTLQQIQFRVYNNRELRCKALRRLKFAINSFIYMWRQVINIHEELKNTMPDCLKYETIRFIKDYIICESEDNNVLKSLKVV